MQTLMPGNLLIAVTKYVAYIKSCKKSWMTLDSELVLWTVNFLKHYGKQGAVSPQ